ncbi:MAG: hypothetical protein ACQEUI_02380, partial [Actinomycetota bacterium]
RAGHPWPLCCPNSVLPQPRNLDRAVTRAGHPWPLCCPNSVLPQPRNLDRAVTRAGHPWPHHVTAVAGA